MTIAIRPSSKILDALWTWEDLQALPEDGNQYEIIDGELYVMTTPTPVHQEIVARLFAEFYQRGRQSGLGRVLMAPISVRLSPRDIVQPDILYIAKERRDIIHRELIEGAPDIVVEVFSPSTRSKDRNEKADLYARSGVREYWQVDPRHRTVAVLALHDETYEALPLDGNIARSAVLPDLAIDTVALFEDLT